MWRRRTVLLLILSLIGVCTVIVTVTVRVTRVEPMWTWLERLSWVAGLGSLIFALAAWRTARGAVPSMPGPGTHHLPDRPATGSIDVPLALLDVPVRGRSALIGELDTALRPGNGRARVHVLHGLGGTGKTTVALALARSAGRRRGTVWWISAATETDLSTGMRQVAARLGADPATLDRAWAGQESATELLWRLLDRQDRPWLLVIDNADNPEWLAGAGTALSAGTGWLRPVGSRRGRIVVTSREGNPRVWGSWCELHPVQRLSTTDAVEVLRDRAGPDGGTTAEAATLAERLGGLPLALHLAGSYLADAAKAPWPGAVTSFADYREALDDGRLDELLGVPEAGAPAAERDRRTVTRTWEMSLDLLERRGVQGARTLLYLLSVLADAPVPYHRFLHVPTLAAHRLLPGVTVERLRSILRELAHLGLVELTAAAPAGPDESLPLLRIHPLVREVGGRRAAEDGGADYVALAAHLLHRIAQEEGTAGAENVRHRPLWEALSPHCLHLAARVPASTGLSADTVGQIARAATLSCTYIFALGDRRRSEIGNRMVIAACAPEIGGDHPALLVARHTIASCLQTSGAYADAEAEYRSVLAARRRTLGEEHPQTLTSRHQIAYLLTETGRFEAAERDCRDVLATCRRILGADHYRTLVARSLLGLILLERGNLDEAEAELRELVVLQRETLGAHQRRTLWTRMKLAEIAFHRQHLGAAERSATEVRDLQTRIIGPAHEDTIRTRLLLCRIQDARGRHAEAAADLDALDEAFGAELGDDHPLLLAVRDALAQVLGRLGHRAEAIRRFEDVLSRRGRVLGAEHPDTSATRERLARLRSGPAGRDRLTHH